MIKKTRKMILSKYIPVLFAMTLSFITQAQAQTLTLEECRRMALEQNKKIKAAQYNIDAAKAAKSSASASAYPSIDGSITGAYLGKPIGGALNGAIPEYLGAGMLTVSQPVYAGGKIRLGEKLAGKSVEISEEQKVLTTAEVLLQVEQAYWQVVQVNEKIVLAEKYKAMLTALQKDLKNSYDAGLIYKNDLLRVEVNLNEAILNLDKAEDGLVMAKLNLAQITGNAGNTDFSIADTVSGDFSGMNMPPLADAPEKRPEIKLLQRSLEAGEMQKQLLKADFLPSIGLSAAGLANAGKGVHLGNGSDFMASYYGLASINIPIFDWGKRAGKVKEQTLKIAAQQQQLAETKEMISLEVQQAWLALNQSSQKIKMSVLSLQQADENLKLTNDRFKAGTIAGKDVQEAQAIWQQAYSSVIDAKVEYRIHEAAYKKSIGELK